MTESTASIDVVHCSDLSLKQFQDDYLSQCRPVIIQGVAASWRAAQDWVLDSGDVNLDFLDTHFGTTTVPVTIIPNPQEEQAYGEAECTTMTVKEYCTWWRNYTTNRNDGVLYYLKDWHFVHTHPEYQAYTCPEYFDNDWLNEWFDYKMKNKQQTQQTTTTSDYRFLYLGPQDSKTPLHADVLRSHSWSVNITGYKKWRLLPPPYCHLLADSLTGTIESPTDFYTYDTTVFSNVVEAHKHIIEVIQEPLSAIFVPSGWFHTVENISRNGALSINHNWMNESSIENTWEYLQKERARAEALIADCRALCDSGIEFEGLVQRNLLANCGMGYKEYGAMLRYIGSLSVLSTTNSTDSLKQQRAAAVSKMLQSLVQEQQRLDGDGDASKESIDTYYKEEIDLNGSVLNQLVSVTQ